MAYLQINAFSNRYYLDVVISGLITLISVFGFISIESLYLHVLILFSVLFLGNVYIYKPHFMPVKTRLKSTILLVIGFVHSFIITNLQQSFPLQLRLRYLGRIRFNCKNTINCISIALSLLDY